MMPLWIYRTVFALILILSSVSIGRAHPHIFIESRLTIAFNDQQEIFRLDQTWTFDAIYSAWAVQGLDLNEDGHYSSDELQPLADDNMAGLEEYGYYSLIGVAGDRNAAFKTGHGARMTYDGTNLELAFVLDLTKPLPSDLPVEIEIADPEYYAAFEFAGDDAVFFDGAPDHCAADVNGPRPIDPAIAARLSALGTDVLTLPPDLVQAVKDLSNIVIVRCRNEGSETELIKAQPDGSRKSPFVAPPQDKVLSGAGKTGFSQWLNVQQRAVYRLITDTMTQMRQDGSAFWILGGLSFLYGLLHAAGPGHGKVVVSSYMVASEHDLKQGIALSFASAMMQATVAVLFVLAVSVLLKLGSFAARDAAYWMTVGSYAMVMALGAWMIWRKLFRRTGHRDSGCGHCHTHDPGRFRGKNRREQVSLILSVGFRPCSGALVVLVFAHSQNMFPAGVIATFLMGVGTAITVSAFAVMAVYFKNHARKRTDGNKKVQGNLIAAAELTGAVIVFGFGAILLQGAFAEAGFFG